MKFLRLLNQPVTLLICLVAGFITASPRAHAQRNFSDHMDWRGVDLTLKPGQVVSLFSELNFGTGNSGECGRDLNGVEVQIDNKVAKAGQITLYSNHGQIESWQRVLAKQSVTYDLPLRWNNTFCNELSELELVNDGTRPIRVHTVRFRLGRGFVRGRADANATGRLNQSPKDAAFLRTVNGRR